MVQPAIAMLARLGDDIFFLIWVRDLDMSEVFLAVPVKTWRAYSLKPDPEAGAAPEQPAW